MPGLIAERVDELLEQTGLLEVKDRKIRTFSGGMLRRLGIVQSLLNEPEILLLEGLEDVYLYHFGTGEREQEDKTVWES